MNYYGSSSSSDRDDALAKEPSDRRVSVALRHGLERIAWQTTAGMALGGLAGLVLARGGAHSWRKGMAGFGGGIGLGSAWTRTSLVLEDFLHVPTQQDSDADAAGSE